MRIADALFSRSHPICVLCSRHLALNLSRAASLMSATLSELNAPHLPPPPSHLPRSRPTALAQPRALLVFCPPVEQNRTVFFWAPVAKWGLVAAGIKDLQRPADKLSLTQNLALAATGFIWVSAIVEVGMTGRRRLPTSYPASHLSAASVVLRSPCVLCEGTQKMNGVEVRASLSRSG